MGRSSGIFSGEISLFRSFAGSSRDDEKDVEGKKDGEEEWGQEEEWVQTYGVGDPNYGEPPEDSDTDASEDEEGPFEMTPEQRENFMKYTHVRDDDKAYWDAVDASFKDFDFGTALLRRDVPMKNQAKRLAVSMTTTQEKLDPQYVVDMLAKRGLCTYIIGHKTTNKVVKGGNMHTYTTLVVVGNGRGTAGWAAGKGDNMEQATAAACALAYRDMQAMDLFGGNAPYVDMKAHVNGSIVEIRSRDLGGRRRCSPMMFLLCEAMGLRNVVIKCHGNRNVFSMVPAFFKALRYHRTADEIAMGRGLRLFHHTHRYHKINFRQ